MLPVLFAGGTLILPRRFEAAHLAELVRRHRPTRALLTPSLLANLLDLPAGQRSALPGPLRTLLVEGAPLPARRMEEAVRRLGPSYRPPMACPRSPPR